MLPAAGAAAAATHSHPASRAAWLTSLNCTMCGCTRSRWLRISRSTYLVTWGRGGGARSLSADHYPMRGMQCAPLRCAAVFGARPAPRWPPRAPRRPPLRAYLVAPLNELDGDQLAGALVARQLHKTEGAAVQVSNLRGSGVQGVRGAALGHSRRPGGAQGRCATRPDRCERVSRQPGAAAHLLVAGVARQRLGLVPGALHRVQARSPWRWALARALGVAGACHALPGS